MREESIRQEMRSEGADFIATWAESYNHRQKWRKGKRSSCFVFFSGPVGESL